MDPFHLLEQHYLVARGVAAFLGGDQLRLCALNAATIRNLRGVHPNLVQVVRRAAQLTTTQFIVVQGVRTQAAQNKLYDQGRTRPGPIVTWTRQSKHVDGRAIDFVALVGCRVVWKPHHLHTAIANAFKQAAAELEICIVWGGDWEITKDWGHIELES